MKEYIIVKNKSDTVKETVADYTIHKDIKKKEFIDGKNKWSPTTPIRTKRFKGTTQRKVTRSAPKGTASVPRGIRLRLRGARLAPKGTGLLPR